MCAQFTVSFSLEQLRSLLGFPIKVYGATPAKPRVLPFTDSLVLRDADQHMVAQPMQFSLLPSWSETRRPKFATHNARSETIAVKPTWKNPAKTQRAIVPLSSFIEPVYRGPHAGSMIDFFSENEEILLASALYDVWRDPESGEEVFSFAIITGPASQTVAAQGHDRQPLFLSPQGAKLWLAQELRPAEEVVKMLLSQRVDPPFSVRVDRALKPGWEKKVNA